MLRDCGIAHCEKCSEFADRALTVDQLAEDQQPMPVRHSFQQVAGLASCDPHLGCVYLHNYVYTKSSTYCQLRRGMGQRQKTPTPRMQGSP